MQKLGVDKENHEKKPVKSAIFKSAAFFILHGGGGVW